MKCPVCRRQDGQVDPMSNVLQYVSAVLARETRRLERVRGNSALGARAKTSVKKWEAMAEEVRKEVQRREEGQ